MQPWTPAYRRVKKLDGREALWAITYSGLLHLFCYIGLFRVCTQLRLRISGAGVESIPSTKLRHFAKFYDIVRCCPVKQLRGLIHGQMPCYNSATIWSVMR